MKTNLFLTVLCLLVFSCGEKEHEYKEVECYKILAKKYAEQESIGRFGAFRINRCFLYDDGYLEQRVELEDYIKFEPNDTVYYTIKEIQY